MNGLKAEKILRERCTEVYDSLVMQHSEGFPLSNKESYWDKVLQEKYPKDYPLRRFSKLDAFTFFAGLEVSDPEIKVELGNYRALKEKFERVAEPNTSQGKKDLLRLAQRIQCFYELPGLLLLSQLYIAWAKEFKSNAIVGRGFAVQATQALGVAVANGYEKPAYEVWRAYDASLAVNKNGAIQELMGLNLLTTDDLDGQRCMQDTTYERVLSL